jgi:hypothetical protein
MLREEMVETGEGEREPRFLELPLRRHTRAHPGATKAFDRLGSSGNRLEFAAKSL